MPSNVNPEDLETTLSALLPARKKQLGLLTRLFADGGAVPAVVFIYGHTATGKSYTVKTVLQHINVKFVQVNCVEMDTPGLLAATIAQQISDLYSIEYDKKKCTNLAALVNLMEQVVKLPHYDNAPLAIVVERSERLRNLPNHSVAALLKLQEFTCMNVCLLLLSDIVWEKFLCKSWFQQPIKIFFDQYTKDEILQILRLTQPEDVAKENFYAYTSIVVQILFKYCRDINELKFIMEQNLTHLKHLEVQDAQHIYHTVAPLIGKSVDKLHLRQGMGEIVTVNDEKRRPGASVLGLELPYYAKFLLLSAFLASYNAPKHDKRLYMKYHGKERKQLNKKSAAVAKSRLLVGPKSFNYERLSAIFHAITDINCAISANLGAQLNTLVNLKLINRLGFSGLADPKYTCAVGIDFVTHIGRTVHFNVNQYLMNQ